MALLLRLCERRRDYAYPQAPSSCLFLVGAYTIGKERLLLRLARELSLRVSLRTSLSDPHTVQCGVRSVCRAGHSHSLGTAAVLDERGLVLRLPLRST